MVPFKKLLPSIYAIIIFIVFIYAYFPPLLEGKSIGGGDKTNSVSVSKEARDYNNTHKESALWTNSMFSGMPTTFVASPDYKNLVPPLHRILGKIVPYPFVSLLIGLIGFYILLLIFGLNHWIAIIGSIAYNFCTLNFDLLATGHNNKILAISLFPWVVSGIILVLKNKKWLGTLLFSLGLYWEIASSHLQMTYYLIFICIAILLAELIVTIKEKTYKNYIINIVLLTAGTILAVAPHTAKLWSEFEYSQHTIRAGTELTDSKNTTSGLDRDYILAYSYEPVEAFAAFIPRVKGGGMSEPLSENSETYKLLVRSQGRVNAKKITESLPLYWGGQPIVGAPIYYGAVLCFLFVFGLFTVKGKHKWWIVSVVILSFFLSLGKNFALLSNFFIDYVPLYNKFRDVKNIVVIQVFAMGLLGILGLREVIFKKITGKELTKKLGYAFGITGGLALIFAAIPGIAGNFTGSVDAQLVASGWPQQLIDTLHADRRSALQSDALRTFFFVSFAAITLWAYIKNKVNGGVALIIWGILIFADMWPVNKKYLNNDDFSSKKEIMDPYKAQKADLEILKDEDIDYRVLSLQNPFQNARTSFFHKSVGGYSAAKLRRYQELIDHHLLPEMQEMINKLQGGSNNMESVFSNLPAINMLNTRYIIYDLNQAPIRNPNALGNAWFVPQYKIVENADEEIDAMNDFNPSQTAIIDQRFEKYVKGKNFNKDPNGTITLTEYQPNYLKYSANTATEQLTVFSEIYYDKGWEAFIDGKQTPIFRVDYVLRAIVLPAGEHTIEFKFEPRSYYIGNKISLASSILLLLAILGYGFSEFKKRKKKE